ncbi:ABC transporter permease [Actinomadura sp. NTSP31]|uniref:ABC transporter permease n=1 Tax=Actinomadura sp. NTSP31 TaxID=1735447 RepID=UPI0035C0E03E
MLKTTLRGLLAHKVRLLLTAVAITLGVGFIAGTFVLTDTMNQGVQKTFAQSAGKVDVAVLPKDAGDDEARIPAGLLARVRGLPGVTDAQGQVRGSAALIGKDGKAVGDTPTLGLSVPKGRLLRHEVEKGRVPGGGSEMVLDTRIARKEKFKVGDQATVLDARDAPHRFTVVGLVDFGLDGETSYRGAVGFDPATAMRMTGEKTFAEIDVLGGSEAAVAAAAGGKYEVLTGKALGHRLAAQAGADTDVVQAGLLIFGLVAMLVSALVIYNTFSILIAQRMREMALLRCVGATRRQVFGGVVAESFAVGVAGSLLGLLFGLGVGAGALALFGALGTDMPADGIVLAPRTVVVGMAVGVVVTVMSALLPARVATRVAPVTALRTDTEPGSGRFRLGWVRIALAVVLAGIGALAGSVGLFGQKGETAMYAVAAAGALIFLAVIAVMPALIRPLSRLAGAIPARLGGVPGRLAVENARRAPRRTATTTIALTIGIGLMSLFAVVGAGAKATTDGRLAAQFPVDFQIQNQFGGKDGVQYVPRAVADRLQGRPEIGAVIQEHEADASIGAGQGTDTTVMSLRGGSLGSLFRPDFQSGSMAALKPGGAIVDADSAKAFGLSQGQSVQVRPAKGTPVTVRIGGVYDAAQIPVSGLILASADFDRHFTARAPSTIYVKAGGKAGAAAARKVVDDAARPYPTVKVISSAEIKEQFVDSIDTVLMIFAGLLGLAIVIALFGIANTLTLSVVERTRESALLRALGLTRRQLRRMLSIEALVMSVIGAFTGVVLGVAFGWAATRSMTDSAVFSVPYLQIAGFIVLAGAAGMLAAVLPARRAAKTSIVESIAAD